MDNDSTSTPSVSSKAQRGGVVRATCLGLTLLALGAVLLQEVTTGPDLQSDVPISAQNPSGQAVPVMAVSMGEVFALAGR